MREEKLRAQMPLTHKKLEFDFLKPTEILYQKLIPSLNKYVVCVYFFQIKNQSEL